jgi:tetratricopeptide (TPR) repeat protein
MDLDRSVLLSTDYPLYIGYRAKILLARREYKSAIADLTLQIAKSTPTPETLQNRGTAYLAISKFDQAIADFKQALALQADPRTLHTLLMDAYERRGDTIEVRTVAGLTMRCAHGYCVR